MRHTPSSSIHFVLSFGLLWILTFTAATVSGSAALWAGERPLDENAADGYTTEKLQGRIVWLADALQRLHDVRTTQDAKERVLALETEEGALIPLVEDRRGRSFRKDERLRNRKVELLVRRYERVPLAQVIRVYSVKPDGNYLLDYWCEVCAISMVELGPCDCCQGPIELRERKVE